METKTKEENERRKGDEEYWQSVHALTHEGKSLSHKAHCLYIMPCFNLFFLFLLLASVLNVVYFCRISICIVSGQRQNVIEAMTLLCFLQL